ncbi:MAG TPA: hypothetical protein VFK94_06555 [Patescibacteria group bacterium]|nr:hypothetical protein [Patescibacteria group bacterium]
MKRQFDENQQAWNVIAELTRRMQIIDNAVRGTQRFINARQHHGQEYRKDKT